MTQFPRVVLLSLTLATAVVAQEDQFVFQRNGFVSVTPGYQSWSIDDSSSFSQTAMVVSAYFPLGRQWSISFRSAAARVSGDVPSLKGAGDTQIGISHNLMDHNVVLNASVNVPSGKQMLTPEEFQTSILVSRSVLDWYVPNFGQGFGVTIGGIWGIQLNEKVVIGVGASYAYLGTYTPLEQYTDTYDPGDELLLTGGVEYRLSNTIDLSGDVIFTTYGRDKLEDAEVFGVGNKVVANARIRKSFGGSELWFSLLYRSRGKSEFAVGETFVTEAERFIPNQFEVRAHYQHRFSQKLSGRVMARVELGEETADRYSGASMLGIGLGADFALTERIAFAPAAEYDLGTLKGGVDVSGIRGAIAISWRF